YWLRFVSNHVSQAFARVVEEHGVTVAEWVLMRQLLDAESAAPSRLAERMGMTRGAITKLADRLIGKELVVRTADPEDGRAQTLRLSPAGRTLVPKLAALADANDAEFFGHLSPDERAALVQILRGIVERRGLVSLPVD
ncbi:MAG TPA: MarR family transcriptional regulator, partial [Fibrobacteria bacterium]|nr:MarR family transcriptional regulator [Fibrobacteria bacterium]